MDTARDKWNQIRNDWRQLGLLDFSKKYKKSLAAGAAGGIALGLYASGVIGGNDNPYQELNQTLQQITDTDNIHYQLDLFETIEWKIEDCFQYLHRDGAAGDKPQIVNILNETERAYRAVIDNLQQQEVPQVTEEALHEEIDEAATKMTQTIKDIYNAVRVPLDI